MEDIKKKLIIMLCITSACAILSVLALTMVLVANWSGISSQVNIDYDTSISNIQVVFPVGNVDYPEVTPTLTDDGYVVESLELPQIHNMALEGWYLDNTYQTKAEFPLSVDASTIIYANMLTGTIADTGEYGGAYADCIVYNQTNGYYEVKGNLNPITRNVIIPDYFNDGTHGLKEVKKFSLNKTFIDNTSSVEYVRFNNVITDIPINFCYNAYWLTQIHITPAVTNIQSRAFESCPRLIKIDIDEANSKYYSQSSDIDYNCVIDKDTSEIVLGCKSTIVQGSGATSIGEYAFSGMLQIIENSDLESIWLGGIGFEVYGVTTIKQYAFSDCNALVAVRTYGIETIEQAAFENCYNIKEVLIAMETVNLNTGEPVFVSCTGIETIVVSEQNPNYDSRNDCNAIVEKPTDNKPNSVTLIQGCKNTVIPSGITEIGYKAFYECHLQGTITVPQGVTSIGWYSFGYCNRAVANFNVVLPETVTTIGSEVFYGSTGLSGINLPSSLKSIGSSAFYGCTGLLSGTFLSLPYGVEVGNFAFYGTHCQIYLPYDCFVPYGPPGPEDFDGDGFLDQATAYIIRYCYYDNTYYENAIFDSADEISQYLNGTNTESKYYFKGSQYYLWECTLLISPW